MMISKLRTIAEMSGCLKVVSRDAAAGIGNVSNRTRMGTERLAPSVC